MSEPYTVNLSNNIDLIGTWLEVIFWSEDHLVHQCNNEWNPFECRSIHPSLTQDVKLCSELISQCRLTFLSRMGTWRRRFWSYSGTWHTQRTWPRTSWTRPWPPTSRSSTTAAPKTGKEILTFFREFKLMPTHSTTLSLTLSFFLSVYSSIYWAIYILFSLISITIAIR